MRKEEIYLNSKFKASCILWTVGCFEWFLRREESLKNIWQPRCLLYSYFLHCCDKISDNKQLTKKVGLETWLSGWACARLGSQHQGWSGSSQLPVTPETVTCTHVHTLIDSHRQTHTYIQLKIKVSLFMEEEKGFPLAHALRIQSVMGESTVAGHRSSTQFLSFLY